MDNLEHGKLFANDHWTRRKCVRNVCIVQMYKHMYVENEKIKNWENKNK